ncbi:MAG: hypothetical protein ACLQUT_03095 [Thermoleophilia bacterium]
MAPFFGHSFDTRIFMATGYLVGTGHSPYVPENLSAVFHHVSFNAMTTVGYPPPWPLILGLLYRAVYAVTPNLFVYNLAMKLPVIAANVGLAYLVAAILQNRGAQPEVSRQAWVFLLVNPALLYFGTVWGQIDAIVTVVALAALVLLAAQRRDASAALLALACCFKPIAAPVALVALVYIWGRSRRQAARFAAVFVTGVVVFYLLPFFVFGWSLGPVLRHWNAQVSMAGTMSLMTVVRLAGGPLQLPGRWWLFGLVWIPALAAAIFALRDGVGDFDDLVKKSTAFVLVFFLTRTWLAEPNVVLLLPLLVILTSLTGLDRRALTAIWVLPLLFTVFNYTPLGMLFVAFPGAMVRSLAALAPYAEVTLAVRAVLVLGWQATGWWIVVTCLRRSPVVAAEGLAPCT